MRIVISDLFTEIGNILIKLQTIGLFLSQPENIIRSENKATSVTDLEDIMKDSTQKMKLNLEVFFTPKLKNNSSLRTQEFSFCVSG